MKIKLKFRVVYYPYTGSDIKSYMLETGYRYDVIRSWQIPSTPTHILTIVVLGVYLIISWGARGL